MNIIVERMLKSDNVDDTLLHSGYRIIFDDKVVHEEWDSNWQYEHSDAEIYSKVLSILGHTVEHIDDGSVDIDDVFSDYDGDELLGHRG